MSPNDSSKNVENQGQELCIKRNFTAVISCNPHIKLQISDEMQKDLGLYQIKKPQKKNGENDDWEQYFALKVDHEPEMLVIQNINNIHNEVQKNIPDEVLEKIDTYISALSLTLGFGFVIEDLYVSGYQILDKEGKPEIQGSVGRRRFRLQLPFDIEDRHREKFEKYFSLLSDINENYRSSILRAVKWWGRGTVETDQLDKFIDFYVALEILGGVFFPNESFTQRVKKICEKYELRCRFNSNHITGIRGALFHSGKKEELAKLIADEFGKEVLKAIKAAIDESSLNE